MKTETDSGSGTTGSGTKMICLVPVLFFLVFLHCTPSCFSQLQLLKDISTAEHPAYNEYSWLTNAGVYMYFVSNNELWKSNGTAKYTIRLKRFSAISNLTMAGNTLYFTADDGISGPELWKSNGAYASTVRVKDIVPGKAGSSPSQFTYAGENLFFTAFSPGAGIELWKTDGTAAGTMLVKDISRGSANPKHLTAFNGSVYFSATGPSGNELWKSGGSIANTVLVKDLYLGIRSSNPKFLTVSGHALFFRAFHPDTGTELWISNGSPEGTRILKDIRPGKPSSAPENLIHANSKLMFTAHDGIHGDELWASDGTSDGTTMVKDMNPGSVGSNNTGPSRPPMGHFTNINGFLYFVASKGTRDFIYQSDGSYEGTNIIMEASHISDFAYQMEVQPEFTYRNGYVYFFNTTTLYKMPYNGKVSSIVRSFLIPYDNMQVPWNSDTPVVLRTEMISMGGSLYFPARLARSEDDLFSGYELVRSNGTAEGTVRVQDTFKATANTQVGDMITHNGRVYMLTYGWLFYTAALYSTDGTPDGTYALRPHREHFEWEPVGNDLYIVEEGQPELESRWQLTKTQGTPETTEVVIYGVKWEADTQPKDLENINGVLYYFNDLGEVWKTDGTAKGTVMLKDFYSVTSITNVNGQAFIVVENQNNALEIWKTTSTGFARVKTFNNTTQGNVAVSLGGVLYFVGYQDRFHLFRSDGTAAGSYRMFGPDGFQEEFLQPYESEKTFIMYDLQLYFNTGRALFAVTGDSYKKVIDEYVMKSIESNGNLFLFTFSYQDGYLKAYVTDGTAENTTLLLTVPQFQSTLSATTVGKYVYFSSIWTPELWRTDGTVCATTSVNVGTEGAHTLGTLGNDLIFGGYRPATGLEPYIYHNINRIPTPVCEPVAEAQHLDQESHQEEDILTPYPNPFSESFAINVKGKDGERARVVIYNASGMPLEVLDDVTVNTEYANIGSSWQKGFYIIKAVTKGSVITRHIVKR